MSLHRTVWLSATALTLGCLLLTNSARAGDKDVILSKSDSLTEKDEKDTKMKTSFRKVFTVKLTEGQAVKIDLVSKDFDTFLRLEDAKGKEVGFNDDVAPQQLDSRLVYVAPKAGEYRIIATSFEAGKTGLFTVEVVKATEAEAKDARLVNRLQGFAASTPAERKAFVAEVVKNFQAKEGKLEIKDAQLAAQLSNLVEDESAEFARDTYRTFIKIFGAAEDMKVASVAKYLEGGLKKLEMLGKTMAVTGKTVDGKDFDLKNLKGKVVLVDFWATWCGPCIAEMPNMLSAHAKYGKRGFEIIGVSLDRTDDAIVKFNEARKIPWTSINIEDSKKLADTYGVNAIPFPVLVDREGNVVSLRARGPQLDVLLERLFPEEK